MNEGFVFMRDTWTEWIHNVELVQTLRPCVFPMQHPSKFGERSVKN